MEVGWLIQKLLNLWWIFIAKGMYSVNAYMTCKTFVAYIEDNWKNLEYDKKQQLVNKQLKHHGERLS